MKRIIAAILAVVHGGNGLVMVFAPRRWWDRVPGVADTGPFNPHFVQDVGAAFLAAGLGLAARAWRTACWPAAMAGAAFLTLHAVIHVGMIAAGMDRYPGTDLAIVVLPAVVSLYAAWPARSPGRAS